MSKIPKPPIGLLIAAVVLAALTASARQSGAGDSALPQEKPSAGGEEFKKLNQEVATLFQQGRIDEALALALRAVEVGEKEFGPEHRSTSNAIANLAIIHTQKKQTDKALPLFGRVLSIREKSAGPSTDFEKTAFEIYLCIFAAKAQGNPPKELAEVPARINEVMREDSIIAQGFAPPFAKGEIGGGKAVHKPAPRYPDVRNAGGSRVSVTVPMRLEIDEGGNVTEVKALACNIEAFARSAEEAVRGAKFEPTVVRGKPVKVSGVLTYNYRVR